MNLSFAGCGFLGIYHVGVASCFREYAPNLLVSKIAGASVGSIAAVALLCDVSLGQTTTDVLSVAVKARSRALGPLHPGFDLNAILKESLERGLPQDAHITCNGRLFISCTKYGTHKNVLLSEYNSREELIQALLCSCFIPFYSGFRPPVYRDMPLMDGGLSNNLPVLDEKTITVSPFSGEHDICPQDESYNILQINLANTSIAISPGNMYRFAKILFPPHPEVLSKMCQQGFDDALKFLQRKNLIACTRCMAVQSSLKLAEKYPETESEATSSTDSELEHAYDDCIDCRYRRQMALLDSLPESVVKAIQESCDQVNKGLVNWIFRRKPIKFLSFLGIPYVLPIDISIVIFCKIWQKLPMLQKELQSKFQSIITLIKSLLNKFDSERHLYSAQFSCQLAITEFDYTEANVTSSYNVPKQNIPPHESCLIKTEDESLPKLQESITKADSQEKISTPKEKRQHRKSYAGFINSTPKLFSERLRRKSMIEISQPERILRNMKFGFTVNLAPTVTTKDNKEKDVVDALRSLTEEDRELNIMEITNKALNFERERISQCHGDLNPENADTLGQIFNNTNEAVMSYYYVDEDKTVKVTELYNVDDADTSAVLSQEEREVNNKLQWESDWIHMQQDEASISNVSLPDTFDDAEFESSDHECDLTEKDNSELQQNGKDTKLNAEKSQIQRKKSFIILN